MFLLLYDDMINELSSLRSSLPRVAKHCGHVTGRHKWNTGMVEYGLRAMNTLKKLFSDLKIHYSNIPKSHRRAKG